MNKKGYFSKDNQPVSKGEKRRLITNAIERELVQFEDERFDCKAGEAAAKIAKNIIKAALSEDKWAIEFIVDRTEGKPKQVVETNGETTVTHQHLGLQEIQARVRDMLSREPDTPPETPISH